MKLSSFHKRCHKSHMVGVDWDFIGIYEMGLDSAPTRSREWTFGHSLPNRFDDLESCKLFAAAPQCHYSGLPVR